MNTRTNTLAGIEKAVYFHLMPTAVFCHLLGAVLLTLFCLPGCDATPPSASSMHMVQIADVPDNVQQAAQKALPDVEFTGAWKNVQRDGSVQSYEIRGKNPKGKIRECRVSPSGEILELE